MQYDAKYNYQISIKGQALADRLVYFPIKDDIHIEDNFSDGEVCQVESPST